MSDPAPQSADLDAVRRAVRPLRLAAGSLSAPTGGLGLVLAAAEALPEALAHELGLVSFSPFAALPEAAGAAVPDTAAPAGGRAPARGSASTPGPPSTARRPSGRGAAAAGDGGLTGRQASETPRPTPAPVAAIEDVVRGLRELAGAADSGGVRPAPQPLGGVASQALAAFGAAGAALGKDVARVLGNADVAPSSIGEVVGQALTEAVQAQRTLAAGPTAPPGAPAPGMPDLIRELVDGLLAASGPDRPPARASRAGAAPEARAAAPDAPAAPASAPLDAARRALLATGNDAAAGPSAPESGTAAARAGAAPPAAPAAPFPGVAVAAVEAAPAAAAELAPDDLAWLVNEALVEQARRHGVDLS